MTPRDRVVIETPPWMDDVARAGEVYQTDADRMRVAIELSRRNVTEGTGGPFGAAIFDADTGALVAAGVNSVVRLRNSALHAEVLAIMLAEQRLGTHTLKGDGTRRHELFTSCDPCAMCLGALLWSGVTRIVAAADRLDASAIDFDEGPVFPESYAYLESRGITIVRGLLREEAADVLTFYRRSGGQIYNA